MKQNLVWLKGVIFHSWVIAISYCIGVWQPEKEIYILPIKKQKKQKGQKIIL